jgi:uncharacterized protein (TIGR03437 family)
LVNVTVANGGPAAQASTVPLPRILGGTFVAVNGVRAPLLATSAGKMQIQLPIDLPAGDADVVAAVSGTMSNTVTISVAAAAPAIVAVVHGSGAAITPASPAVTGETVSLYLVGMGAVSTPLELGAAAPSDGLVWTRVTPQVSLGGAPMSVNFSGLAPGFIGLYQVNVVVPSGLAPASTPTLTLSMGSAAETASAAVAIQ